MSEDDNPSEDSASARFFGGFLKGFLNGMADVADKREKRREEEELERREAKSRQEERARRKAGTFLMETHQVVVRDRNRRPYLLEFKYEYQGELPEDEAFDRLDAILRQWTASFFPSKGETIESSHLRFKTVIISQTPVLWGRAEIPPAGFLDNLYVTKIEPFTGEEKTERYTLEDQARDLAALIEKEKRLRTQFAEQFAGTDEKSEEFQEHILDQLHAEKLKIISRPLSD